MKLKNVTKHGVKLTNIEWSPHRSEETQAFTASVQFGKMKGEARNDGRGGANIVSPWALQKALDSHAASLPPVKFSNDRHSYQMDADLLLSLMMEEAVTQHEDEKMLKQGYKYVVTFPNDTRMLYTLVKPSEAGLVKQVGAEAAKRAIVRQLGTDVYRSNGREEDFYALIAMEWDQESMEVALYDGVGADGQPLSAAEKRWVAKYKEDEYRVMNDAIDKAGKELSQFLKSSGIARGRYDLEDLSMSERVTYKVKAVSEEQAEDIVKLLSAYRLKQPFVKLVSGRVDQF